MIAQLIKASVKARMFVLLAAMLLVAVGVLTVRSTPVDALPDLSDVQASSAPHTRDRHRKSLRIRSRTR